MTEIKHTLTLLSASSSIVGLWLVRYFSLGLSRSFSLLDGSSEDPDKGQFIRC